MKDKYIVVVSYSFDPEKPLFIFDTEEDALDHIEKDFENEKRIEIEESGRILGEDLKCYFNRDEGYARMEITSRRTGEVDVTEWAIGDIRN